MRDFVDTVKAFAREEEAVGVVEIIQMQKKRSRSSL